ncbi:MBL fold metallo-hydrolase [Mycobacterium sp. KBS0706]|uniref:MBL fold metallo-hydrolase n=1 Tax=Mycobacterium sp. KBS0706 TaxID=2578109 RepID=UPI00110FE2D3|nr:MBL fold metallo-hydrolase [Mycobacterium sp. KBS0706]TSD88537.1 MBL fold metallo-hydrolase [Mycobacterium sp. KBS0706]
MTASVRAISGVEGKGPACFLVEAAGMRLLLDCGAGPDEGMRPDLSGLGPIDAILLSHAHPDHIGALPEAADRFDPVPVYATPPVLQALPEGSPADRRPLGLGHNRLAGDLAVTCGRSGHAPGGVWLHLAIGGGLFYAGDMAFDSVVFAVDAGPPPARVAILDASYGDDDTPHEHRLAAFAPIFAAKRSLLLAPAGGRGPEIALAAAAAHDRKPAVCDANRAMIDRLIDDPAWLRPGAGTMLNSLRSRIERIESVEPPPERAIIAAKPNATGGAARPLLEGWGRDDGPVVATGYVAAGSPARRAVEEGRAVALRWPVHPRLSQNVALAKTLGTDVVVPAFGDAKHRAAWAKAFAPARTALEETVEI